MASSDASSGGQTRQTKRIMRDLEPLLTKDPLPFITDLQHEVVDKRNEVHGVLIGPSDTAYADCHYPFAIKFPPEYPFKPPDIYVNMAISHPNIESIDGKVCHDQLTATWSPSVTLRTVLTEIYELLKHPNYDVCVEGENMDKKKA